MPPNRSAVSAASASRSVGLAHVARARDHAVEPEVVAAARREPEVHAGACERLRDGRADAAARAGDHCGLAFEVSCVLQRSSAGYSERKRS